MLMSYLRDDGIDIITIGIGKWIGQPELEAMASFPKTRNTFVVPDHIDLFEISDMMLTTMCDCKILMILIHVLYKTRIDF